MENELIEAIEELDEERVMKHVVELLESGMGSMEIMRMLNKGMLRVGLRFENGEYYLADLIMSGILYRKALAYLDISQSYDGPVAGTVLIGVVENDIHDIGKDIINASLQSEGFLVFDLGTDVNSAAFVSAALEFRPDIIALSGTMGYAAESMISTIQELHEAGVSDFASIIVGGSCVTEEQSKSIGADGYAPDPIAAIGLCKELMAAK